MNAVTAHVKSSATPSLISAVSSAESRDGLSSKASTFSNVLKETKVAQATTNSASPNDGAKGSTASADDATSADGKAHAKKQSATNTDAVAQPVVPQTLAVTAVSAPITPTDASITTGTPDQGVAAAMLALINAASPKTAATAAATAPLPTIASTSPVTGSETKTTIGDDISDAMASAAKTASALSDALGTASAASGFGAVLGLVGKGVASAADALASIAGADGDKKSSATPDLTQLASQLKAPDAATAPAQLQSTQVVGTPAFAQELGDQIAWMGNGDVKEASIRLNPQDMGQLDVKISMHQNRVDVAFTAQHPNAVQAVTQTLTQLDTMLAHHGLQLGQTQVGQQQSGQGGQSSGSGGNPSSGATDADDTVVNVATVRAPVGLVDDFA